MLNNTIENKAIYQLANFKYDEIISKHHELLLNLIISQYRESFFLPYPCIKIALFLTLKITFCALLEIMCYIYM